MGLTPNYPDPVVVCSTTGTGVQPGILDIEVPAANSPGFPPVLQVLISNTATVLVKAALQVTASATPALVDPIDVSGGGFTVTLPQYPYDGMTFHFSEVKNSANALVIDGNGKTINGAATLSAGSALSPNAANLSMSRPDELPIFTTLAASLRAGMAITHWREPRRAAKL